MNIKKSFVGLVTSAKTAKTITVSVETKFLHPRYKKLVIVHKKYHAHDEKQQAHVGDRVKIVQTRPISKTKFYCLDKILEVAK